MSSLLFFRYSFWKRSLDVVVSLVILMVALPVMLVAAAGVRLALGSPIIFRHTRPGLHGQPFVLYKFRTMRDARQKDGTLLPDAQRLTSFGRFLRSTSVDELPQLWNVLRGDMSLVGPRPLMMEYLPLYSPEQARRHEVRPGITGSAQINGRNALTWDQKFALDVWYVENQSFWADLKILARTLVKVVIREGISYEGEATTTMFTGSAGR